MVDDDYMETGRVGRTHGVAGFLNLRSDNTTENLLESGIVRIRDRQGTFFDAEISQIVGCGDGRLVRFKGYDTKEKAAALSGALIFVRRENARPLGDGETYYKDLIGLSVVFEGSSVGKVINLIEGAQSLILEILKCDGKKALVPYMKVFVAEPDVKAGSIELLNGGLLE